MSGGGWGVGVRVNQFPTFDAEFNFAKIQNSHVWWWWWGFMETNFQLLMLSSSLLKSKILMSGGRRGWGWGWGWGWGGCVCVFVETNFQLLILSSNLLKSKIPMSGGGRGVGGWGVVMGGGFHVNQFPTFDAEFKFAKIQNSHVWWGVRGGCSC